MPDLSISMKLYYESSTLQTLECKDVHWLKSHGMKLSKMVILFGLILVISESTNSGRPVFDALKGKVKEIGLKYYPDDNVFPLSKFLHCIKSKSFLSTNLNIKPLKAH